ncbi:MAG: hypothetical protein RR446_02285 [Lachnospiraceae bacterium]
MFAVTDTEMEIPVLLAAFGAIRRGEISALDSNHVKGNITDLAPNKITSRFKHILKSNGLPKFRFHDLRHYNASISHALGIPDAYIMQKGGWGSDRVLKDVYRHTMNDTEHKMNTIAIQHFENMQHEMQHEKNKA